MCIFKILKVRSFPLSGPEIRNDMFHRLTLYGHETQLPQRDGEDTLHHRPVQGEERGAGDGDTAVTGDSG